MRILLTGVAGFVGQHLKARLAARRPDDVILEDPMDIRDRAAVERFVRDEKPEACIHLAAVSSVERARADTSGAWTVNLDGTLILAETFEKYARNARFLYVSTAEIYGSSFRTGEPLDEKAVISPVNPYAASKAAADMAIGTLSAEGLHALRLRSFSITGTGEDRHAIVSYLAAQVARIEAKMQPPVVTVRDPSDGFDIMDVRDACDAYIDALEPVETLPDGAVLNVCTGRTRTVRSILHDLMAEAGVSASIESDPSVPCPSGLASMQGNPDATMRALGWRPKVDWKETVAAALNDWRLRIRD
ncbi:NAD-dependent epimerase/dehydratase family protein [Gluconobacter morbifer]|uniref:Putative oxidoreductase n=1 Tax=Gluconobacter morbifer G707 TaxID=1088869 RepID=G6XMJ8_9PROT|nr:NAD-dependent epimerase/dehydratase family protein [Gluconobacter morbifer]EHH67096.1 putative oxidoreductase [Gluconobacter morbifer G707]